MQLSSAASLFKILSVRRRLEILVYLLGEKDPIPSSTIGTVLRLRDGEVSGHLTTLAQAGLVLRRPQGRWVFYTANKVLANDLSSFLLRDKENAFTNEASG